MQKSGSRISVRRACAGLLAACGLLIAPSCVGEDGDRGPQGPPGGGAPTPTDLAAYEDAPGVVLEILGLSGGTGAGGSFQVGDRIAVRYTVEQDDGGAWMLSEFSRGRILVSGPTFNYQRVIPELSDLLTESTENADGSFTYRFATPIPATYAAPYNDTASFGADDGELTGQALLDGTYTVGMYVAWDYTVEGESFRDAGNATKDFVIGAGAPEARAVVAQENCDRCHDDLRAHGGIRRDVTLCLMCHTAGSEDKNNAAVAGGTPGASIDFRVMIHKIHNGAHLPSVLGVGTNANGTRNYAATPAPYELVGYGDSIHDYSGFAFPVMPSAYVAFTYDSSGANYTGAFGNGPMPRDTGYSGLTLAQKQLEDRMRTGAVACDKCHGDPDGAGPLGAPAQGDVYENQPSRLACGSCHDDVDWGNPYTANGQTMPSAASNADCTLCHAASGDPLAVEDAHLHPYSNPAFNTGVNIDITAVTGSSDGSANHQLGDAIGATFSVTDDLGADLGLNGLLRFQMIVVGPSSNPQWMLSNVSAFDNTFRKSSPFTGNGTVTTPVVASGAVAQTIAVVFTGATAFDVVGSVSAPLAGQAIGGVAGNTAAVTYNGVSFTLTQGSTAFAAGDRFYFEAVPVASSYTMYVPRDVPLERLGAATGAAQTLSFGNVPAYWGRQVIYERTALVGSSTSLTEAAAALGRYVACDSAALALAVGDRVALDAGTAVEEYLTVGRIQTTDDWTGADLGTADRISFTAALRYDHALGGTIQECTLTSKREGTAYTMAMSGATSIDLVAGQFTAGNPVVAAYRTHGRFGYYHAPGGAQQASYGAFAAADTDEVDGTWGDWKGLALVDGTYTVGMWVNRDFTVTPLGLATATEAFNNLASDNTTYRMMAPPASLDFLYGAASSIEPRSIVSSGENCDRCHGDLGAHGNGRRGFGTCVLCHATPGLEDGPKFSFASWYVGPTPGVTMDFRTLLHKVHMGKELANASTYVVNGVFLGTPYPVTYEEVGFPATNGGAKNCAMCHGEGNDTWQEPVDRDHPTAFVAPVREWRAVCGACHDSDDALAHIEVQTSLAGEESCGVCHGDGAEWSVEILHKIR